MECKHSCAMVNELRMAAKNAISLTNKTGPASALCRRRIWEGCSLLLGRGWHLVCLMLFFQQAALAALNLIQS